MDSSAMDPQEHRGVFVFKNGFKPPVKRAKKKPKQNETVFSDSLWYGAFKSLWEDLEEQIQDLNNEMFSNVLKNLVNYIKDSYREPVLEIPTAALLTGINMPDHHVQFKSLLEELVHNVTPHVANLKAENCQNMKTLVENLVNQLLKTEQEDSEDDEMNGGKIKKSQCNFRTLLEWYQSLSPRKGKKVIVVIIPEFENFCERIMQDFIQIASSYLNVIPFVFVFGISTSVASIHRTLPYQVSSKINVQVFQSPASVTYLNNVLENVFFTKNCPFYLGDQVFNLFTDIFLFYDLSVSGFIQNIKYAMLQHFSYGNAMALCKKKKTKNLIESLTHDDLENVRRLMSFRKLVENEKIPENRIGLISDDAYFKDVLKKEIRILKTHLKTFHLFMKALHVLVCDLPRAPLGKQVRELYSFCVANVTKTPEYKESFQLLGFQSKDELSRKLAGIIQILTSSRRARKIEVSLVILELQKYLTKMDEVSFSDDDEVEAIEKDNLKTTTLSMVTDRAKLKEQLLQMSKQSKRPLNKYEKLRQTILDYLLEMFGQFLADPMGFYFHEVFFFNDISIRDHLVGSHRAAIHAALTDPQSYLQCSCCKINDDSIILSTMPDLSIAYKLHLECGKMINMYDWLQAFLTVLDPRNSEQDSSKRIVKPELQARFTQAVAELEFLGFIKSSKRKTDHVARLTWGG